MRLLTSLTQAYTRNPGPTSRYSLAQVLAGAQDLIDEVTPIMDNPPIDESHYSFHLSFVRYPLAKGYSWVIYLVVSAVAIVWLTRPRSAKCRWVLPPAHCQEHS